MPQIAHANAQRLPLEAVFLWRSGHWHMQSTRQESLKPVSVQLGHALDSARRAGALHETSPGLFRVAAARMFPLNDASESPLQRLAAMRQGDGTPVLDTDQVAAGERLRRDYETAHLSPRVVASYDPAAGARSTQVSDNHIAALNDAALAARQRLHVALDAIGPELSGILLHVCCMASGLEQAELRLSLPRRAGKAVLQLALSRLARHYHIKPPLCHGGPSRIGHWAQPDFKPQIAVPSAHQP